MMKKHYGHHYKNHFNRLFDSLPDKLNYDYFIIAFCCSAMWIQIVPWKSWCSGIERLLTYFKSLTAEWCIPGLAKLVVTISLKPITEQYRSMVNSGRYNEK